MDVTLGGLQAYVEDIWDRLPKDLTALAGDNVASLENDFLGEIGEFFARKKVQNRLGVYLNHRHFDLMSGERFIAYGSVQIPWQLRSADGDVKARIAAKAGAFLEDVLIPPEFTFATDPEDAQPVQVPEGFRGTAYIS